MTINNVIQEMKKRQNTNVKGSIVFSPILMIGKEVPHNTPAKIVEKTALALSLNRCWGKGCLLFLFRQYFLDKAFLPIKQYD